MQFAHSPGMLRLLPRLRLLRQSLRAKVTLGLVLPLIVILGTFTMIEYRRERADIVTRLSSVASYSAQLIQNRLRHEMQEEKAAIVDRDACMECGACALNCAAKAISVDAGVGCAAAVIQGMIKGTEPTCGCSDEPGKPCC